MKIPVPVFKSCLGFKLKTGCLLFGYTQLIMCSISTFAMWYLLPGQQTEEESYKSPFERKASIELRINPIVNIAAMVIFMIMASFTISLLIGLHRNIRPLVNVFMVFTAAFLLLSILLFTVVLAYLTPLLSIINPNISFTFDMIATAIIFCLPQVFFLLIVKSQYYQMGVTGKNETNEL